MTKELLSDTQRCLRCHKPRPVGQAWCDACHAQVVAERELRECIPPGRESSPTEYEARTDLGNGPDIGLAGKRHPSCGGGRRVMRKGEPMGG